MSKNLFLFTIGPVQSFIAQARKTQDLYAGSKLLSDLIEKAINKLKNKFQNVELIFPNRNIQSKPNRFIAKIETDNIEKIGKELENCVKSEFKNIANSALKLSGLTSKEQFIKAFEKQINNFLQIYWVAIPLNEDYQKIYSEIERYLGTIKNVRVFKQLEETGRKCSICGERNVLVYRKTDKEEKEKGPKLRRDGLLKKLYVKKEEIAFFEPKENNKLKIQKGEGLCAICFTKRFYENISFPSTSKIAAMDWLNKIDNKNKDDYKANFKNFDEELYYEENLREEYLNKYEHFKDKESLKNAKNQLKKLYNQYGTPKKYYALLMLDGDNMGKWLSGEFLENKNKLKDFHIKLSENLGEYANYVRNCIKEPAGKLIYAGGDDVLAFVNLGYLLDVMSNLRDAFPNFKDLGFKTKNNSSASAGIVIAHYKAPLSEVLKWARKMEKEAKNVGKKDAFAIAVLRRSGEIHKTVWKWDLDENRKSKKIELLKDLIEKLQNEKEGFSYAFIKNLYNEFMKLDEIEDKWLKAELKRLLDRACQIKGDKTKKDEEVKKWQEKLFSIYIDATKKENFFSFLSIADFLARKIK